MEQDIRPEKERNWAFTFSPCMIVVIFAGFVFLFLLLAGNSMGAVLAKIFLFPAFVLALLADISFKIFLREVENRATLLWIAQPILIMAAVIITKVCIL